MMWGGPFYNQDAPDGAKKGKGSKQAALERWEGAEFPLTLA
jgi:hypothetical protein